LRFKPGPLSVKIAGKSRIRRGSDYAGTVTGAVFTSSFPGKRMMENNAHRGHCLCEAVKYKVAGEPLWSAHCHCSSCRRNTGSSVATFVGFNRATFALTEGAMAEYRSSPNVTRYFCRNCGTPVAYRNENAPEEIHLFLGTLDHPENYPAKIHVHFQERLPWLTIEDAAKRYDTLP
jgi:hypothetical protein